MSLPAIVRTWKQLLTTGVPGKRIAFVSLIDTMQNAMFTLKDFLVTSSGATTKFTLLWSASGGTGPTNSSDHTDRITNAAAWTPRATVAAASQAWMVLVDAAGVQWLICYQGASDDVVRISFSPSAAFTLAGTTNNQPTATDEQVLCSATSVIGSTASADRLINVMASDDGKAWRLYFFRSSVGTGQYIGGENFTSGLVSPASISPNVWGFSYSAGSNVTAGNVFNAWTANTKGGLARTLVSAVNYACQVGIGVPFALGSNIISGQNFQPELQGSGFSPYPVDIYTNNASGSRGRLGNLIDWWTCAPSGVADGDGFGNSYQFVQYGCLLIPNPSNTAPTIN